MTYQQYLLSDDWQQKRRAKLARTRRCAICAETKQLDVHHLNYRDLYDVALSDLRVLCRRCHRLAHELYRIGAFRFTSTDHHHRFALTKNAVKKALRLMGVNLFQEPVRDDKGETITRAWLHRHKTANGGFTRTQLRAIGVSWPPPKGWLMDVIGKPISDVARAQFEAQV